MNAPATATRKSPISLVEAIVLLLILVGTFALILPALPAAREQARTRFCQANLRRLDLGAAQYGEAKRTPLDPLSWTLQIMPYCEDLTGVALDEVDMFGSSERPSVLTCPSRPIELDSPTAGQIPHYELVMDNRLELSWAEIEWRFRDRPSDPEENPLRWFVGVSVSFAEADRQWREQPGPHLQGRYNQSDSKGNVETLPLPTE